MITMRAAVTTVVYALIAVTAVGQSVTFSNMWLEHNVPTNDGPMLKYHYTMSVKGCQGHEVSAYMYIDDVKYHGHIGANGQPLIAKATNLGCAWPETYTTGDWWVGIFNKNMNAKPDTHTYYTRLGVKDETTGQWIGWSDFLEYTMTGAQPQQPSGQWQGPSLSNTYINGIPATSLPGAYSNSSVGNSHNSADKRAKIQRQIDIVNRAEANWRANPSDHNARANYDAARRALDAMQGR